MGVENQKSKNVKIDKENGVMKVEFSTSKLLVTFLNDNPFCDRKLVIKGEALSWGFDVYPSTMKWLPPFDNEEIDDKTRKYLVNIIAKYKSSTNFQIKMREE